MDYIMNSIDLILFFFCVLYHSSLKHKKLGGHMYFSKTLYDTQMTVC